MAMTSRRRLSRARPPRWPSPPARPAGSRSSPISPKLPPAGTSTGTSLSPSRSIRSTATHSSAAAALRAFAALAAVAWPTAPADAHGFGQRHDLPIPLSFYLFGAAAAVVVTFVVVGLFVRHTSRSQDHAHVDL